MMYSTKKLYFYSTLIGLGLGTLYISRVIDNSWVVKFVSWVVFWKGEVATLVINPLVAMLPLVTFFFVITISLWKSINIFRKLTFTDILKANLLFLLGIILAFIYLGFFVQIR